jgi:hypothetical protein
MLKKELQHRGAGSLGVLAPDRRRPRLADWNRDGGKRSLLRSAPRPADSSRSCRGIRELHKRCNNLHKRTFRWAHRYSPLIRPCLVPPGILLVYENATWGSTLIDCSRVSRDCARSTNARNGAPRHEPLIGALGRP